MKKAFAYEIFIYVLSVLIVGLVLYYGYNAVKGFGDKQKQLQYITFKTGFENIISTIAPDYGTVRAKPIQVPSMFTELCIVDPNSIKNKDAPDSLDMQKNKYPLIYDSVTSGVLKNIFPMPNGEPFYVEKIQLEKGFECFPVVQGQINARLEGLGDRAKIS